MDKSKVAAELFDENAEQYQEKYMDVSLYASSFNSFCQAINKKNAHILEVACGPGNITKYLLQKRPDFKVFGIDLSKNMIGLATINNPTATFKVMDCRAVSTLTEKYDAVMCGFCLPYLSKEEALHLISDASELLNPSGVIYISTMEGDYSTSQFTSSSNGGAKQLFTHYHEEAYLVEHLTKNNFTQIEVIRQDFPVTHGDPVTDLLLIAKK